jgi:urea transporter
MGATYLWFVSLALFIQVGTAYAVARTDDTRQLIRAGLYGYDGVLVGAAAATFLATDDSYRFGLGTLVVVLGAALATLIKMALSASWSSRYDLPTFTMGFNLATLLMLAAINGIAHSSARSVEPGAHLFFLRPSIGADALAAAASASNNSTAPSLIAYPHNCLPSSSPLAGPAASAAECAQHVIQAWFRGVAQVYFCDSWISGLFLCLGFALCSPISACAALLGSAVGFCVGLLFGAPPDALMYGLWGYNGVIGCMAVCGIFYRFEWRAVVAAAGCAALCTLLQGVYLTLFAPIAMPVLTLPFCTGAILWLQMGWPVRLTLAQASTPEAHMLPRCGIRCRPCGGRGAPTVAPMAARGSPADMEGIAALAGQPTDAKACTPTPPASRGFDDIMRHDVRATASSELLAPPSSASASPPADPADVVRAVGGAGVGPEAQGQPPRHRRGPPPVP